jgi:hypothetical protein
LYRGLNLTTTLGFSGLSEEMYHQQIEEKWVGLPRRISIEMNRMIQAPSTM